MFLKIIFMFLWDFGEAFALLKNVKIQDGSSWFLVLTYFTQVWLVRLERECWGAPGKEALEGGGTLCTAQVQERKKRL